MLLRGLGVGRDKNVVARGGIEFHAALHRERQRAILGLAFDHHAAAQGLSKRGRERGHADRRSAGFQHGALRICRVFAPCRRPALRAGLRLRAGGLAFELRHEPVEAVEIVAQAFLHVVVRVADDADGTAIARVADDSEQFQIEIARAEWKDLSTEFFPVGNHAVEVQAEQIRLHRRECRGETVKVIVAVMLVVNDADIGRAVLLAQPLRDGDQILRLAAPAAVIVEADRAAEFARALEQRQQRVGGLLHALVIRRACGTRGRHPNLRMQAVLLEQFERLLVRCPKREEFEAALFVFQNLRLELAHVLGAPIVGDLGEAEFGDHLRALGGTALLRVERHDAPRGEIGAREKLHLGGAGRSAHETHETHEKKTGKEMGKGANAVVFSVQRSPFSLLYFHSDFRAFRVFSGQSLLWPSGPLSPRRLAAPRGCSRGLRGGRCFSRHRLRPRARRRVYRVRGCRGRGRGP